MKSKPITIEQLASRTYNNAKARTQGKSTRPHSVHLYKGLPICEKEEFMEWALNNRVFKRLYNQWKAANYDIRFVPSPDRMDSYEGYVIGNIKWVPFSENCSQGRRSARGLNLKEVIDKISFELTNFVNKLDNIRIEL